MAEQTDIKLLKISNAPHTESKDTIPLIMWTVFVALMPAAVYAVLNYGIKALIIMLAGIISAVITEALTQKAFNKPITIKDGSAVLTGLLVAMNVPPASPVWMTIIGSAFAIFIVKQLFGGLGFNIFNPALAARAFMVASWPVEMTTKWFKYNDNNVIAKGITNTFGYTKEAFDTFTSATPLGLLKEGPKLVKDLNLDPSKLNDMLYSPQMIKSMFYGNIGGSIGETSALLLLLGGIFLIIRKVITWHIPIIYIATVAALSAIYYSATGHPAGMHAMLFHVISGGLFLGAFFMATDMVTSPVSGKGMIIFAIGCGLLTFVIRLWGGYPEGVSYSILLMNAAVPLIDRLSKPKVFGANKKKSE